MVKQRFSGDDYDDLEGQWPDDRPSRKRQRRLARRRSSRQIDVRAQRRREPDVARMSRALLAAQKGLAEAQDDTEARRQREGNTQGNGDD